jgi:glucose-1-phosphate cytidylyltransferase
MLGEDKLDWRVTLVETGASAMTGMRIRRASRFLSGDRFFATYGDAVSNVDLAKLLDFHLSQGKAATVTGVRPSSRFGELQIEGSAVRSFVEKPQTSAGWINGGFFVFETAIAREFPEDETLSLETQVLENLAARNQLSVFKHNGFWQCMDTFREMQLLNDMWVSGAAPWKTW